MTDSFHRSLDAAMSRVCPDPDAPAETVESQARALAGHPYDLPFEVPTPILDEFVVDDDLPGAWSRSDFEGGDPDERSYAQRQRDREAAEDYDEINNRAALEEIMAWESEKPVRVVADLKPYQDAINKAISTLASFLLPEVDPPLCRQEIPAEGTE